MAINVGVAVGPLLGAFCNNGRVITVSIDWNRLFSLCSYTLCPPHRFGIKQIEGEKKQPVTFVSALRVIQRDVTFRYYILGGIIGAIGYSQVMVTLSQYLEQNFSEGVRMFAVLMSVNAIVVIAMQIPLTRISDKYSPLVAIILVI